MKQARLKLAQDYSGSIDPPTRVGYVFSVPDALIRALTARGKSHSGHRRPFHASSSYTKLSESLGFASVSLPRSDAKCRAAGLEALSPRTAKRQRRVQLIRALSASAGFLWCGECFLRLKNPALALRALIRPSAVVFGRTRRGDWGSMESLPTLYPCPAPGRGGAPTLTPHVLTRYLSLSLSSLSPYPALIGRGSKEGAL